MVIGDRVIICHKRPMDSGGTIVMGIGNKVIICHKRSMESKGTIVLGIGYYLSQEINRKRRDHCYWHW